MERIRPPAVAGSFYPSSAEELEMLLEACFVSSPLGPKGVRSASPALFGGMVPHAGYIYSGPCAAHLYARFDKAIRRVVVLGVNHRGRGQEAALSPADYWETPLGKVPIDRELNDLLKARVGFLREDERPHQQEHSIEVQLPFLQKTLGEFALVPIALSLLSIDQCAELGQAIANLCMSQAASEPRTVFLASSDLSHYLSPEETERLDQSALEKVLAMDPVALLDVVGEQGITMCGVYPTAVLLFAAKTVGAERVRLLQHCHSGDAVPMSEVVGYASVALEF